MEELGFDHPVHRRVPWPPELAKCTITLPQSFIQLLTDNNPISSKQADLVQEFRKRILQQVELSNSKIQYLEEQIAQIKQVNKGFQKQLFACNTVLSPFRHISNDILYQVSSHLAPMECLDRCTPTSHSALVVSQVSQSWRQTLHGVSNFWTTIHIDCTNWNSKQLQPLINRVEHYSLLSASHPLTVQLDDSSKAGYKKETDGLLRMLSWIFTEWSSRYRLFRLRVRASNQTSDMMHSCQEFARQGLILPNVESYLTLPWDWQGVGVEDSMMDEDDFVTLSRVFPKLHSVWLGRRSFMLDAPFDFHPSPDGSYSLSYLTSLYLDHWIGYQDFIQFLTACPQLEAAWFEMGDDTIEDIDDFLAGPLVHRNMKELNLRICGFQHHILRLFTNLKFPCLTNLQLHLVDAGLLDDEDGIVQDPPNVEDFMDTFPSLDILFLHDIQQMGGESFRAIFSLFPIVRSITHLVLHGITLESELQDAFENALGLPDTRLPLPRLQTLELVYLLTSAALSTGMGQNLETVIIDSLSRKDQQLSSLQVQLKILALSDNASTYSKFVQDLAAWLEKMKTNSLLTENTVLDSTIDFEIVNPWEIMPNRDKKFEEAFMDAFF